MHSVLAADVHDETTHGGSLPFGHVDVTLPHVRFSVGIVNDHAFPTVQRVFNRLHALLPGPQRVTVGYHVASRYQASRTKVTLARTGVSNHDDELRLAIFPQHVFVWGRFAGQGTRVKGGYLVLCRLWLCTKDARRRRQEVVLRGEELNAQINGEQPITAAEVFLFPRRPVFDSPCSVSAVEWLCPVDGYSAISLVKRGHTFINLEIIRVLFLMCVTHELLKKLPHANVWFPVHGHPRDGENLDWYLQCFGNILQLLLDFGHGRLVCFHAGLVRENDDFEPLLKQKQNSIWADGFVETLAR